MLSQAGNLAPTTHLKHADFSKGFYKLLENLQLISP